MQKRTLSTFLALLLLLTLLPTAAVAADTTGIHDIFTAKDESSKLELFKARLFNRILYLDTDIDVSDIGITEAEIQHIYRGTSYYGSAAVDYMIKDNPLYSTVVTMSYEFPKFTYQENGQIQSVQLTYHPAWNLDYAKKVIQGYDEAIAHINPDDSDFAKILKLHDWIVNNVAYSQRAGADFATCALAERAAVCAGYTRCYQFLLDQAGIESIYIAAQTSTEKHAWNLVKLDGHWFHVDCTWDRGTVGATPSHRYFLLNDEEFNADGVHTEDWKDVSKGYPTNNLCSIENKFYQSLTPGIGDNVIAENPLRLTHVYPSTTYNTSETEHWRTCAAGVEIREPHTGDPCTVCGYSSSSTPAAPELTTLEISGADTVHIPSETIYTVAGKDQDGTDFDLAGVSLTWSVDGASAGVSIDNGGKLTVTDDASAGDITIHASFRSVSATKSVTLTVRDKPVPTVTAPTANTLTYNGAEQALVTAGTTSGGEMQYKLDNGAYSTEIPKAKNAGSYTVYYKVVGGNDFADVAEQSVTVTIAKKAAAVAPKSFTIIRGSAIPNFALTYTGLVSGDSLENSPKAEFVCYASDNTTPVSASTAAGTYTITWTNINEVGFSNGSNYDITKNSTGTLTIRNPSSGGGSSSGGSSSDRSSSGSSGTKTETTTNPDGSTTQIETGADGTVTTTTTYPDGSMARTEMKKDGSSTTERRDASGSTGTVKTDANGRTEASAKVSDKAVSDAKKNGDAVMVPVKVDAGRNSNSSPAVSIDLPRNSGQTKIEIPVSNVNSGTVAIIVHEDGTEEIAKTSTTTENGVQLTVNGNSTVKIMDNSKNFVDTRNHWSRDQVNFVAARELFQGVTSSEFGVSRPMTRAMVNTVLARLAGIDTTPTAGQNWYEKGIAWAQQNGVSDGTNPNGGVTREQLAAMLYRYAGSPAVSGTLPFTDAHEANPYAQDALLWAVQNGILNGYRDGRVAPKANAQRAQVAAMMARFIQNTQ